MNSNPPKRILIINDESALVLALSIVLRDQGYVVRCSNDWSHAAKALSEFKPDAMVAASETVLFISKPNSAKIVDLSRPVSTDELLHILESNDEGLVGEAYKLNNIAVSNRTPCATAVDL